MIFMLTVNKEMIVEIIANGILDLVMKKKSRSGILLLGKIYQFRDSAFQGYKLGATQWAFQSLNENPNDIDLISASLIVIAQSLVHCDETDLNKDEKIILSDISKQTFGVIFPLALKYTKVPEIASNSFASLTYAAMIHPEIAIEKKCLSAASSLLAMYIEVEVFAQNYIGFFYACGVNGYIKEIKNVKGAIPTIMKAYNLHPENERIVSLSAAIFYICDHSDKF
jgi:hypothetical protein